MLRVSFSRIMKGYRIRSNPLPQKCQLYPDIITTIEHSFFQLSSLPETITISSPPVMRLIPFSSLPTYEIPSSKTAAVAKEKRSPRKHRPLTSNLVSPLKSFSLIAKYKLVKYTWNGKTEEKWSTFPKPPIPWSPMVH